MKGELHLQILLQVGEGRGREAEIHIGGGCGEICLRH